MGIADDILGAEGWHAALAALDWQSDLGVTEVIGETPASAYDLPPEAPVRLPATARASEAQPQAHAPQSYAPQSHAAQSHSGNPAAGHDDALAVARAAADRAHDLNALREAMAGYDHCDLKKGARNLVFCDGNPKARVMIVGEAPGADEDRIGRPFVGRAGQLLDRMLAAIGLSRTSPDAEKAVYITNVMVWRPPGNRDPSAEEIAMMLPFLHRHIALVDPEVLVLMGNTPCAALLERRGILKLRGHWQQVLHRPAMPMTHPAYLLRNPIAKREAWADLLDIRARVEGA